MEEEQGLMLVQQQGNDAISAAEKGEGVPAAESKLELTVDEVVDKYIGSFGFSQILHVLLVSLAWIFDSQNTLVTIFTDAQPSEWRCKTGSGDFVSAVHINGSSSSSSFCTENINGGKSGNSIGGSSVCGLAAGTWEWVGGDTISTIAEWNLICDRKFFAAIPASLFFLGSLLGSAFFGRVADKWSGRKKAVMLSCILTSATSFFTSFSPNIWVYSLLRFANGFARSGIGICCLVLSTEAVGHKWRGLVGQCGFFFFSAGFLSLPLIAYPTRSSWRTLYKILSIFPLCYSILLLPFVSESPRWLLVMGRTREAHDVLNKYAKLNRKKLPANLALANNTTASSDLTIGRSESLWGTKWAAKRLIIVMAAGFGVGFVYYGIQLNVENLNFNLYFSVALNAMLEIPAVVIGTVLLSCTKRRLLFSLSAYTAGISCILCMLFSSNKESKGGGGSWPQLTIEGVGFMAASTAFDVLYIYCVELFPTNVRNSAVSFLRQALMLGASASPLLVVVGRLSPSLSFLVFGVLSVFSGILSWWLPETKFAPLYETLKQQEEEETLHKGSQGAGDSVFEHRNGTS